MTRSITIPASLGLFALLASLFLPKESAADGFRFSGGDIEEGRKAFVTLNCNQCHTVAEVVIEEPKGKRRLDLPLGGEKRFVKNYSDLVIAITNPQHVINEQYKAILTKPELQGSIKPFMPDLTQDMSVRQLMDLVAFLDKAYSGTIEEYGKK